MGINEDIREIIARTKVDETWMSNSKELERQLTVKMVEECKSVLDIGKSSREFWDLFAPGQIISADINQFKNYPDIIVDVCDAATFPDRQFDGIICHSILEHTYDPFSAVRNLYEHMVDGGTFLGFVPFLMRYHAPEDLKFQDFYRFSRDGLAYLFRDYSDVTLYPVRNQMSSVISLLKPTKIYKTKTGREFVSEFFDRLFPGRPIQTTGYIFHAVK